MLRARHTVSMPMATGDGATEKQEAACTPPLYMDAELHGDTSHFTNDDGE